MRRKGSTTPRPPPLTRRGRVLHEAAKPPPLQRRGRVLREAAKPPPLQRRGRVLREAAKPPPLQRRGVGVVQSQLKSSRTSGPPGERCTRPARRAIRSSSSCPSVA